MPETGYPICREQPYSFEGGIEELEPQFKTEEEREPEEHFNDLCQLVIDFD